MGTQEQGPRLTARQAALQIRNQMVSHVKQMVRASRLQAQREADAAAAAAAIRVLTEARVREHTERLQCERQGQNHLSMTYPLATQGFVRTLLFCGMRSHPGMRVRDCNISRKRLHPRGLRQNMPRHDMGLGCLIEEDI